MGYYYTTCPRRQGEGAPACVGGTKFRAHGLYDLIYLGPIVRSLVSVSRLLASALYRVYLIGQTNGGLFTYLFPLYRSSEAPAS